MEKRPRISEAEWKVMKVLWARSPMSANDVIETLRPTTTWKPKTIKTLIDRLVRKKILGYRKAGRAYLYYPLVDEKETLKAETRSFLKRVYGGALKPLLATFLEDEKLSPEEIVELKRMLDERG
jgi:BlaI family penicillinase repressor